MTLPLSNLEKNMMKTPNNLESFWMPFTSNRTFKKDPRLVVSAEGMYYTTIDGRKILDGASGLWCVNAGHGRKEITRAIQEQAAEMDYGTCFNMSHPKAFELASRLTTLSPGTLNYSFFTNSGSESVDTALKIALAYHRARGEGQRQKFIGRERSYHGVGFGGMSVGGIVKNRKVFGNLLPGVDHLPHTLNLEKNAFSKGLPEWGEHLADTLEDLIELHDASTIAAVIVEPISGSGGVYPPPKGYLEKIASICKKHNLLLIFDEVITGFGRTGATFAAEKFGIQPDMITTAKAISNGTVPIGAVLVDEKIYNGLMQGKEGDVEFYHGYTYSGHPLACAAALATLDIYKKDNLFERANEIAPYFEEAVHRLESSPFVADIRNFGLMAGIQFEPSHDIDRTYETFVNCFKNNLTVRLSGDTLCVAPPLVITKDEIDQLVDIIDKSIRQLPGA